MEYIFDFEVSGSHIAPLLYKVAPRFAVSKFPVIFWASKTSRLRGISVFESMFSKSPLLGSRQLVGPLRLCSRNAKQEAFYNKENNFHKNLKQCCAL